MHILFTVIETGGWFNINMSSLQYRKSHCGNKTILRPSYLQNGISYVAKRWHFYVIPGSCCVSRRFAYLRSKVWLQHVTIQVLKPEHSKITWLWMSWLPALPNHQQPKCESFTTQVATTCAISVMSMRAVTFSDIYSAKGNIKQLLPE